MKERGRNISLVFVTPYLHFARPVEKYDAIIYPEIEDKPLKYAIVYRNRWVIDRADYVIAYVNHGRVGAYKTYAYAKKEGENRYQSR